ncbi:MAG: ATP-binding protein [Kiloniellales bacterium]|nr:ATP-binding protein [Kiloniellales bacterium]
MRAFKLLEPGFEKIENHLKRYVPNTLMGRALLIILTPLLLLQIISTWAFYDHHYDTITSRLAKTLAGDIAAVIHILDRNPSPLERDQAFRLAEKAMSLELSFQKGEDLPAEASVKPSGYVTKRVWKAMRRQFNYPAYVAISGSGSARKVLIMVQRHNGVLKILAPEERLFSSTSYIFISWMVGTSVVLFGVAVLFMRNQVRPIKRLAKAAENFGKGRDVEKFRMEGSIEVQRAAQAFMKMRERIKRQIQQRTEMLAGVSHDLKTPITRMRLQLAMLRASPETENLLSDVAEMERMVEGYLAFARGEGAEQPQPTDLSALLTDVTSQMKRDGQSIQLSQDGDLTLPVQKDAIRRCITNLISNAQRHGEDVKIIAQRRRSAVEVIVDDNGPGIPEEYREEVFRPFHRLESSRNPETGGVGLGLTIARDVARNHGGDLRLENTPTGRGLRARVILPV